MGSGNSNDSGTKLISGAIVGIVILIAVAPKEIWITLGVIIVGAILFKVTMWGVREYERRTAAALARKKAEEAALAAAAKREREATARREKQQRIDALGEENAALVESVLTAVKQVATSEAARAGWLGDVDFSPDIDQLTDSFQKAHALRKLIRELSALDNPGPADLRILAEAKTAAADLELAGVQRVELIGRCATEARLIDKSLRDERADARTAEQRAELHGKLSAMLYGIEATPTEPTTDSTADAVLARVQAYQEIKRQIHESRDH